MAKRITLKKGLEPLEIYFEDADETVTIYFNPSDSDLPKRLVEAQKIIEERSKNIKPFELNENETSDAESCIEYYNEANAVVYDAMDYAFGNKISDKLFRHCGPFTIVDGEYFILQFLDQITPVLEEKIKTDRGRASEKMNKYLAGYRK